LSPTNTARDVKEPRPANGGTATGAPRRSFIISRIFRYARLHRRNARQFCRRIFRDRSGNGEEPAAGEAKGNAQATYLTIVLPAWAPKEIPPRKDRKMKTSGIPIPAAGQRTKCRGTTSELAHGDPACDAGGRSTPEPDFSKVDSDTTEPDTKLREAWQPPD